MERFLTINRILKNDVVCIFKINQEDVLTNLIHELTNINPEDTQDHYVLTHETITKLITGLKDRQPEPSSSGTIKIFLDMLIQISTHFDFNGESTLTINFEPY